MTTSQICKELTEAGKPTSTSTLYRYLTRLGIKPIGAAQRPQRYPDDAADLIKKHLGLNGAGTAGTVPNGKARLATMPELRKERKKARAR